MLRLAQNLTLKQLDAKAGVSATHLSEIERGLTSPTVGAIARIARALGVEPAVLVSERALAQADAVRHSERRSLSDGHAVLHPLGGRVAAAEMSVIEIELAPNDASFDPGPVGGEEFWLVLAGTIELRLGETAHVLNEGDAIHFADTSTRVLGARAAARVLWVALPPAGW